MRPVLIGAIGCAAALAVALAAQHWGDLIPCPLCLLERWPYRLGIVAALAALAVPARWRLAGIAALLACTIGAAALAAVHVGVERHWWPSPLPECSAPNLRGLTVAERLAALRDRPSKSCEDADYPVPGIPITFAEANLLYALALSGGIAILAVQKRERRRIG